MCTERSVKGGACLGIFVTTAGASPHIHYAHTRRVLSQGNGGGGGPHEASQPVMATYRQAERPSSSGAMQRRWLGVGAHPNAGTRRGASPPTAGPTRTVPPHAHTRRWKYHTAAVHMHAGPMLKSSCQGHCSLFLTSPRDNDTTANKEGRRGAGRSALHAATAL